MIAAQPVIIKHIPKTLGIANMDSTYGEIKIGIDISVHKGVLVAFYDPELFVGLYTKEQFHIIIQKLQTKLVDMGFMFDRFLIKVNNFLSVAFALDPEGKKIASISLRIPSKIFDTEEQYELVSFFQKNILIEGLADGYLQ